MEVILLSDVDHVGLRGDVVSVARGYARNYLLPRQLAEEATPARVAELQKRDTLRARHEAKTAGEAQEIAQVLSQTVLRFEVKAGPTGSLFGSVTPTDIADEIWGSKKIRVDRRKIETDPIKRIGRYEVPIGLFADGTYGDGWNGVAGPMKGLFYGGGMSQLTAQIIGVVANFVYIGVASLIIFKVLDVIVGNRVSAATEVEGLDIPEMGSIGYIDADNESADGPAHVRA